MSYSLKDASLFALAAVLCLAAQCAEASTKSGSAMTVSFSTDWAIYSYGQNGESAAALREMEPTIYTGAQRFEPSTLEENPGASLPPVFVKNPFLPAKP